MGQGNAGGGGRENGKNANERKGGGEGSGRVCETGGIWSRIWTKRDGEVEHVEEVYCSDDDCVYGHKLLSLLCSVV